MTNIIPSLFEDGYLKEYAESVKLISSATTNAEIDQAVKEAIKALEKAPNAKARETAKRRLRLMEEMARERLG